MKPTRWLTLLAMLAAAALPSAAAPLSGSEVLQKLRTHDSQSPAFAASLRALVQASLADPARKAEVEKGLLAVLQDPSATFAGKQEACHALWVVGTARSVPVLAKMLPDERLGNLARYALERNPDPAAAKALRDALARTKALALVGVINSLGERGDAGALPQLKKLAVSKEKPVSEAATAALGKVGTPAAVAALKSLPAKSPAVSLAMLKAADRMAAAGKTAEAMRVYQELSGAGQTAVVRGAAILGLAATRSPRAGAAALAGMKSSSLYLQRVCARAFGSTATPAQLKQAAAAWPSLSSDAQMVLLAALGDRREPAAASLALKALESPNPLLRATAIRAAARVGGASAVSRLASIAAAGQGEDRGVARQALASMSGKQAEQALLQTARQGKPEVRASLMSVLVERPTPGAMGVLMDSAKGSDVRVATEALRALGRVGGRAQHAELLKLLITTQDEDVRDAAKDALVAVTQRTGAGAGPVLAALPQASSVEAKGALLGVLAEVGGDDALAELTKAAEGTDPDLKRVAVAALADTWTDARPSDTLLRIAKSDSDQALRVQALRGYIRLVGLEEGAPPEDRLSRLKEALAAAERPEEKRQVLSVLRNIRVPAAVELSAQLMEDPALVNEAAEAVLYLASQQQLNNRRQPAVTGPATTAALDKVIQLSQDENQKAQAQKLKG